ncbi:MAG: phosphoglycerate dehydrogenase [Anaerolineales bacterium]
MKILISAPYVIDDIAQIRPVLERAGLSIELADVKERLDEEQLLTYIEDVDGAICGDDMFTARVLQAAAPQLKVVSKWGTGIDSIDRQAAEELGVQVYNTPNAFTHPVADTVMGFLLSFARGIHLSDHNMKAGRWNKLPVRALNECVLGVIGVGNIGSAILERANAFRMATVGNDIDEAVVLENKTEMVELDELLERSHFVSVNCDLNPTSYHLIDETAFSKMRSDAVLINTARGAVVDEAALVEALRNRTIAGAALDVFEDEPLPLGSPLRSMPNLLLSPHNANGGQAVRRAVHRSTIENLFRGLGIQPPSFEFQEVDEG